VSGLKVRNNKTDEESVLDVTGVFVAIGHPPPVALIRAQITQDEDGDHRGHQRQGDQQTNLAGTVEGLQTIILTMIHAIDSRPVAAEAIQRLGLEMSPAELLDNLSIEQVESTSFIVLTYQSNDPVEATRIVNTVGEVSSELISERSAAGSQLTANVYEEAMVPENPVSPDPLRNGLLAAMFGVMLGIGLALLMEYLDRSWRSPEEVEQVSGVPTFATIPEFSLTKSKKTKRTLA
jgi:capsular polysaccharide biosynthesis protein